MSIFHGYLHITKHTDFLNTVYHFIVDTFLHYKWHQFTDHGFILLTLSSMSCLIS